MSEESPQFGEADGRIPFRVAVGAVGHRDLDDEHLLVGRVRDALNHARKLIEPTPVTPVVFTVVSPLAEGADRLVACEGLTEYADDGVQLVVVLPLPIDDYRDDFRSEDSKRRFDELREVAAATVQPPADVGSRDEAYWRAGHQVVNRSDVLVAIWDGKPARGQGGTAQVVRYARRRGVPVLYVPTAAEASTGLGPEEVTQARGSLHIARALSELRHFDKYNNAASLQRLARTIDRERTRLTEAAGGSRIRGEVERVAAWALPHFARADLRATAYQRRYYLMGDMLFGLSALAVAAVALQTSFAPGKPLVALAEAALLSAVLGAVSWARRGHFHESWIGCRSLAEAFRSALFITITGARSREEAGDSSASVGQLWFRRAFSDAWRRRPRVTLTEADVPSLRRFLATAWIDDQIEYHRDTVAARSRRRNRVVTGAVAALFIAALAVALLHAFEVGHEDPWLEDLLVFLAIALPGFGAAVTGHREQRQYRLHRERSSRTVARLALMRDELADAGDLRSIRRLAAETQGLMLDENLDWYGVVELQELEVVM